MNDLSFEKLRRTCEGEWGREKEKGESTLIQLGFPGPGGRCKWAGMLKYGNTSAEDHDKDGGKCDGEGIAGVSVTEEEKTGRVADSRGFVGKCDGMNKASASTNRESTNHLTGRKGGRLAIAQSQRAERPLTCHQSHSK